ncbi:PRC-barrel domain-containing protein [Mesobacillus zeae]|uniref:Photosystem reaction center subunit H n=1 Tax=Mesobacillus zeae TaxID=1917180 RepID=A0A398B7R2_9BACI|nr:PRC-barrel domain-containing protein [Mesobacillus zeae]RID83746.1 photosystem reaction center subunit H [Mesobacillus zeae]
MRTFSVLKGLPVLEAGTGGKLGTVSDLVLSDDGRVKRLIVRRGNLFKPSASVEIASIIAVNSDNLVVEQSSLREESKNSGEYTLEHHDSLLGRMFVTEDGRELGLLDDVYFHEEVGTIVGYELTDGFFSDISEGKRLVKPAGPPAIEKDAIIVNVDK